MGYDKKKVWAEVDHIAGLIAQMGDTVWDAAEVGFTEVKSAKCLSDTLEAAGFQVERGVAGMPTAFTASFGTGRPVIGILGEFDALPNMSQKADWDTKEPELIGGNGHGCGHNLLGAAAAGAAIAVKRYIEETGRGKVIYFGCPAEEKGAGKTYLVRDGLFEDVDCAVTWHPGSISTVSVEGFLANCKGNFKFTGISSHAALSPHKGRSALDAMELMNMGVQFLREHIVPEARVHYAVWDAGGKSANIVQPTAEVRYLIRAPRMDQAMEICQRIKRIAEGAAMMTDTKVDCQIKQGLSNVIPNRVLCRVMQQCAEEIPPTEYTEEEKAYARKYVGNKDAWADSSAESFAMRYTDPAVAQKLERELKDEPIWGKVWPLMDVEAMAPVSSDLGDVSWACPLVQITHTTCAAATVMHSWEMVAQGKSSIAHKGMVFAAKVMASTAVSVLEEPEIAQKAREELKFRLRDAKYVSPLDPDAKPPQPTI